MTTNNFRVTGTAPCGIRCGSNNPATEIRDSDHRGHTSTVLYPCGCVDTEVVDYLTREQSVTKMSCNGR